MLKLLLILISIISVGLSQVAPSYHPYSLIHPEIELSATQLTVGSEDIYINFTENAQMTIRPDGTIYRLVIQFDGIKSGHMSIIDWQVPVDAMLFIFNDERSYTGPYLSRSGDEYFSGRFISEKLTLEYLEPINAEFSGNFKINGILPDFVISPSSRSDIQTMITSSNRENPKIMVIEVFRIATPTVLWHFSRVRL